MSMQRCDWGAITDEQRASLLQRPAVAADDSVRRDVCSIVDDVRERGDAALLEYTKKFDHADIDSLAVSEREFESAENNLSVQQIKAIDIAIANVARFHEQQLPLPVDIETTPGVRCQRLSHPIDSVGLYVPAGSAPLPSAAIMLAVPASIAGCPARILCTPCQQNGEANAGVLTAARRAGVNRVFKAGGAQAIAAMAYGTRSIPKVEKIFGPGNAWVTAAKTLVAADAGGAAIDMPAGPSEVLVIADETANADFVAADLLSQAEHGEDSQVILVSIDAALTTKVQTAIDSQLPRLSRRATAAAALQHGLLIGASDLGEAIRISNTYAPEHLILHVSESRRLLPQIRNAGSIFLGPWSPESAGDYCSGTNHVLPTYGAAKRYSGLSVDQFLRHMTVQELSRQGLDALAPTIIELAMLEGLDAHANAVRCRIDGATGR